MSPSLSADESPRQISSIKREIRILALRRVKDPRSLDTTWFLGVVFRGRSYLDGVMCVKTACEAVAESEQLARMIIQSKYYDEIRVILSDRSLFDDSSIDPQELFEQIKKPMVVLVSGRNCWKAFDTSFQRSDAASVLLSNFGEMCELKANGHRICLQVAGISPKMAIDLIKKTSKDDFLPEAMNVARMVASAFLEMLQTDQKV